MRRIPFPVVLLSLLLAGASPLAAQAVRGELTEEGTRLLVGGARVVLLDAAGKERAAALSGPDGRFLLSAPEAGAYTLRAERIGHAAASSPVLRLAAGDTVEHRLAVPAQVVMLEGLVVEGERRRCTVRPREGLEAATLWEEARKAIAAAAWTERQRLLRLEVVRYERDLDPRTLRVQAERSDTAPGYSGNPFMSLPARDLAEGGYVRDDPANPRYQLYYAPDAEVLLSDEFLDGHCFRVQGGEGERRGLVGLAFEPLRGRKLPDVRGVLWLDAKTAELRHLEYRYTGLRLSGPADGVGGWVEFERLPTGAWMVHRWWIRMPVVDVGSRFGGAGRVVALKEEGAEVSEIRMAGRIVREAHRTALAGTAFDSIRAAPLAGAEVRISGTDHRTRTGSTGEFRFVALAPGRYMVALHHPRLDSLGLGEISAEAMVGGAGEVRVDLSIPPLSRVAALLCPDMDAQAHTGTGIVTGTVRESGEAVPGATVVLRRGRWHVDYEEYQRPASQGTTGGLSRSRPGGSAPLVVIEEWEQTSATADRDGRYRICGVPAGEIVALALASQMEAEWEELRVGEGEIVARDLNVPAQRSASREAPPQTREMQLDSLVVTGMGKRELERRALGTRRDLLVREEIERHAGGARHVGDVVRRFPGMAVSDGSGNTGVCIKSSRPHTRLVPGRTPGCDAVRVYLDDAPVQDAQRLLATLPLEQVESVEFIPASRAGARYGTGTATGVLVVYTLGNGPHARRSTR